MSHRRGFRLGLLAATCLLALPAAPAPPMKPSASHATGAITLHFGNVDYLHRWSKEGQNEFTPKSDPDLATWQDMVTINLFENATTGEQLADVANRIVGNYQTNGKIIRTDAKPRTKDHPAEYLIVASLGDPAFLEAAFARLLLRDGVGYAVVRSHRIYGKAAGPAMSEWLQENGPATETTLMDWDQMPARDALKRLPQSK
jgi:hypothetical protein